MKRKGRWLMNFDTTVGHDLGLVTSILGGKGGQLRGRGTMVRGSAS